MAIQTVTPRVPNRVRDDFGNEWNSIRSLSHEINVCKDTICKFLKRQGYFKHKGKIYTLKSTPVVQVDSTTQNSENNLICNEPSNISITHLKTISKVRAKISIINLPHNII